MLGRWSIPLVALLLAADPAAAAECRGPAGAPKAKRAISPVCDTAYRPPGERLRERAPGVFRIGEGVEVRIGGRVRLDALFRR